MDEGVVMAVPDWTRIGGYTPPVYTHGLMYAAACHVMLHTK